ncbi:MAG TPA: hypothetical protein DEB10_10695 [Ruminococcaceae bacterium]|mgnify:CR=1 FL=1|nr:hypothetical protein [Oscillospiraceae bacterium]
MSNASNTKTKFNIKEIYSSTRTFEEVFSDILLAEIKNKWTKDKQGDIMKPPTDPNSVLLVSRR